jgi:hypothetical protein
LCVSKPMWPIVGEDFLKSLKSKANEAAWERLDGMIIHVHPWWKILKMSQIRFKVWCPTGKYPDQSRSESSPLHTGAIDTSPFSTGIRIKGKSRGQAQTWLSKNDSKPWEERYWNGQTRSCVFRQT